MIQTCKYQFNYYWNLKEIITNLNGGNELDEWNNTSFYSLVHTLYAYAPIYKDNALKPHLEDLWQLIYARYSKHYAFSSIDEELKEDNIKEVILKIINVMVITYDKYAPQLDLYNSNKDKLLNQIKATTHSFTGFNDTPQDGGRFADDNHRTNVTEAVSDTSTDGDTLINRLDEINQKIKSIMLQWSNEFDRLFIEEGNI